MYTELFVFVFFSRSRVVFGNAPVIGSTPSLLRTDRRKRDGTEAEVPRRNPAAVRARNPPLDPAAFPRVPAPAGPPRGGVGAALATRHPSRLPARGRPAGLKTAPAAFVAGALFALSCSPSPAGALRLSRTAGTLFMEDDLAYARFLCLEPAGTYRQIETGFGLSREVDRGTWEQPASGEVVLHPTNGALTFRAVSAGPLFLSLKTQAQIDAGPALACAISVLLQDHQDRVFARQALSELERQTGAKIELANPSESFSRENLEELSSTLLSSLRSRAEGTVVFDLLNRPPAPLLMIQRDAAFSKTAVAEVRRTYKTARASAPPFYFARVDPRTFRARTGRWTAFDNLGGTHAPAEPAPSAR